MTIRIESGHQAQSLLTDSSFKKKWDDLFKHCRWATPYQSSNYISCWYDAYKTLYSPFLVFQLSQQGKLTGLLPLAVQTGSESFEVAGGHQSEYQAWLADTSCEETFIQESLQVLFQDFSLSRLKFKYVYETVPLSWLQSKKWRRHSFALTAKRPLVDLERGEIALKPIRNKSFRGRLNRLKRMGEVRYSQITDRDQFMRVFPKFEMMYDFRIFSSYGIAPFASDKHKRDFHLALFDREGILHVSMLELEGRIVAFEVSIIDGKTLYGSVASFSPMFARFGATKLHMYYLLRDLMNNNFSSYDLTPGRDPWKDDLANTYENVSEITFFKNPFRRNCSKFRYILKELIIRMLIKLRIKPGNLWVLVRSIGHNFVKGVSFDIYTQLFPGKKLLFRVHLEKAQQLPEYNALSKDNLEDLMKAHPNIPGGVFHNFLTRAQKNFHAGQHPYTTAGEHLFFCGWMSESANPKHIALTLPNHIATKKIAVIRDITVTGEKMSADFLEQALSQMIRDAALLPEIEEVIVALPGKHKLFRECVDLLNHKHGSLLEALEN